MVKRRISSRCSAARRRGGGLITQIKKVGGS
jgi:hypothetical protein